MIAKVLPVLALALVVAAPSASAAPIEVAAAGSQRISGVRLTSGAGGRALLTWTTGGTAGGRAFVRSRTATGTLEPAQQLLTGQNVSDLPFAYAGQRGDLVLGHVYAPGYTSNALLGLRGDASESFGAPFEIHRSRFYSGVWAAGNARGDVAVLVHDRTLGTLLLTAGPDGTFGLPQALGDVRPFGEPGVAIDARGRFVIAYGSAHQALVRRGRIDGPLGAPHVLGRIRSYPVFSVAIDDRGTATVAYSRFGIYRRGARTAITTVAARGVAGRPFGPVVAVGQRSDGVNPALAAAGSTTAMAWGRGYPESGLRVALAHGSGAFRPAQRVGTRPASVGARYASPYSPSIAVDDAGDVLLAYAYGLQSTHATLLPAGTDHFLAPTVLSSLGHGGTPTAAFAANRDPLVAFADRSGVFLADALRGTPVNLRAPQANADPLDPAELRDHTRVTARVGCSSTCVVSVGWRITTGGRGIDGTAPTVISRHRMSGEILRAGERRSFTFDAKPSAADSLLGSGRAKASVSITVANASGVSRTIRQRVEFGCVRTTTSCPRTAGG